MATTEAPTTLSRRQRAALRYEELTEWPMLVVSILIIPLLLVPVFFHVDEATDLAIRSVLWVIWAVFAIDLSIRTYLAEQRIRYLVHHWYDVLIVLVPFLRPLRIARSVRALRLLRLLVAVPFIIRSWVGIRDLLQRRALHLVLLTVIFLVFAGAGLVLAFERHGDGPIDDYGTALWWAIATVTTVGYGDAVPTTIEGRGLAVSMMLLGITLFSWITANIAAFLVENSEADGVTTDDLMRKLESLEEEVRALRDERRSASPQISGD